jgi:hypothetical protein
MVVQTGNPFNTPDLTASLLTPPSKPCSINDFRYRSVQLYSGAVHYLCVSKKPSDVVVQFIKN